MKNWDGLNKRQKLKALIFIEKELREFMANKNCEIYFKNIQTEAQIKEHVNAIAVSTLYNKDGTVWIKESLGKLK